MAKPDFREFMSEDRRLIILQTLTEAMAYNLNEDVIKLAMRHVAYDVGTDIVRAELTWLEEHQLIRLEKITAHKRELWIATLTAAGEDVGRGRYHPGVRRPMAI
jgi:hypothetical protein